MSIAANPSTKSSLRALIVLQIPAAGFSLLSIVESMLGLCAVGTDVTCPTDGTGGIAGSVDGKGGIVVSSATASPQRTYEHGAQGRANHTRRGRNGRSSRLLYSGCSRSTAGGAKRRTYRNPSAGAATGATGVLRAHARHPRSRVLTHPRRERGRIELQRRWERRRCRLSQDLEQCAVVRRALHGWNGDVRGREGRHLDLPKARLYCGGLCRSSRARTRALVHEEQYKSDCSAYESEFDFLVARHGQSPRLPSTPPSSEFELPPEVTALTMPPHICELACEEAAEA